MNPLKISIIVAFDEARVMGKNNSIPWHISKDYKHFKTTTIGKPVILGRKTWDSLPKKPLPGRLNIVLSRRPTNLDGATVVNNLAKGLRIASDSGAEEVFIIGGLQVYQEALHNCIVDRVIASHVRGVHEGDTFFPILDGTWKPKLVKEYDRFTVYEYTQKD